MGGRGYKQLMVAVAVQAGRMAQEQRAERQKVH
jgi:hypothetical protein